MCALGKVEGYQPLDEEAAGEEGAAPEKKGVQFDKTVATQSSAEKRQMVAEVTGASLTTLLTIVLNVTYAGVVFHGSRLGPFMSIGITANLVSTAVSTAWLAYARRDVPYITVADSFMAVLFSQSGTRILHASTTTGGALGTLTVTMLLTSVMLGITYVVIGHMRVCKVVQFVPSPVMAGYQASIGYLLLDSASALVGGCSLIDFFSCITSVHEFGQFFLTGFVGFALYMLQLRSRGVLRSLWMPSFLLISTLLFQMFRFLRPDVDVSGWLIDMPNQEDASVLPDDFRLSEVDWMLAANEALLTSVTAIVPNIIGKLLQYSALEQKFDIDVDYNTEIQHNGISQLFASLGVMTPTVTYLGMVVAYDLGARSSLPPLMVILSSTLLALFGSDVVGLVPKAMFSALLVASGVTMLIDNFKQAWNNFPKREFALVVMHVGLTAALGMLYAVVLGLLFTAVIFIIQYAQHSGVLQHATLLLERSKVARTAVEQDVLEEFGATCLIVHLHGMIFFGSANSVVDEVRTHITTLDELELPLRFLLLDFDRCSAIDSSAVAVLLQTRRILKNARLIFACAGTDVLEMLKKGASSPKEFEHFTTLDLALEHCENRLFDFYGNRRDVSPNLPSPSVRSSFVTQHRRIIDEETEETWLQNHGKTPFSRCERGWHAISAEPTAASTWAERIGSERPGDRDADDNMATADGSQGYVSDDGSVHQRDLSGGAGDLIVYTPEEAREQLEPVAMDRIRQRFMETMLSSYGSRDLEQLIDFMDVMLVPPHTTVSTYPHDEESLGEPHLYILDRGYVSAFATLDKSYINDSDDTGDSAPRHRLAKYGPGTILGVSSFVMPQELPGLTIMPMVSVSDTYCQLLRLPRSRCDALEQSHPALLFRLYRLLVVISERRLQDHRLRVVASEAFKINVIPSSDFQRMLVAAPDTQKDEDRLQGPDRRRPTDPADSKDGDAHGRGSNDEAMGSSNDGGGFRLFDSNPVSDSEYDSDGGRNNAPAVSPPLGRAPIKASGSRDGQVSIPVSSSKDTLNRPGHEPQTEASLSNFQAALIDKIRGDKERDQEERDNEQQEDDATDTPVSSSFGSAFGASADRFKWFK